MTNSKWIGFIDEGPVTKSGKTHLWKVIALNDGAMLGYVRWYGAWRKYSFYPLATTLYESTCLRDLAQFCDERTREHREASAEP